MLTSQTSKKAQETLSLDCSELVQEAKPLPNDDHSYALPSSHDDLRARLREALARVESLKRERRNAQDREKRAKNTVSGLLQDLRVKKLINEELKEQLDIYSDLPIHLLSKQSHEYTKDQKEFAITLHLHGPKAYSYLRETLNINLPHPHTLQRWMSSVDAKPGLNMMMLDMLKRRQEEDPAKYGCVCLMLDAMAIRKHVQYNPHTQTMSGFVDMEDGLNETDVATEALVFMVVGLQGHWKAPIAYYLTKCLSPETQEVLLVHAFEELHKCGIRVKMVSLAAQTLSRSVTVALRTLRDLGYSQFQHCEATAEFIETSPMSDKWEPTVHIVDLLLPCGYLPVKESSKTVKKPVTRRPGAHAHPAVEEEDSSAEEDDELIPVYLSPPVSTVCENPVQPDLSMNNVQDT
ncbi:hypothetical protein PAMA_016997 [Pampus argenteus]